MNKSNQATLNCQYMSRALQLAAKGRFTTTPNPSVGCVLVKNGEIIGEGYTQPAGGKHGEAQALAAASNPAGATAYVTLEPCSHHGRTPPCADALITAGIKRVVIAMADPNPVVTGNGVAKLQAAGIEVESGLLEQQAQQQLAGFSKRMVSGLPKVIAKVACSLDGRTAMASGESQWITGPQARYQGQRLRAASCAIITGIESILLDDSSLTIRTGDWLEPYAGAAVRQPLRVVVDSNLRLPLDANVITQPGECLVVCAQANAEKQQAFNSAGVSVLVLPNANGRVDLPALLAWLAKEQGCNQVLVEAGATLTGSFVEQGLLDELHVFQAPVLLGSSARPMFNLDLATMAEKVGLTLADSRKVGSDQWLVFKLN